MPVFYFDVHDGIEHRDRLGETFPGIEAARAHAMQIAAAYAGGQQKAEDGGAIVVGVRDITGARVLTVRLAFSVEGG